MGALRAHGCRSGCAGPCSDLRPRACAPRAHRAQIFLEADDFRAFADAYADNSARWPFFKVLVRKCCSESYFGHNRPLYAIDIAILHTAHNLALSTSIFKKYKSAMLHPSKYVGPLYPTIPMMQCSSHAHAR